MVIKSNITCNYGDVKWLPTPFITHNECLKSNIYRTQSPDGKFPATGGGG